MSKIKNCPCCNYSASLETMKVRKGWEADIHCNDCGLSVHTITFGTEQEAIDDAIQKWNRRMVLEEIVGKLEEKENEAVLRAPITSDLNNPDYQKWMMKSYGFREAIEVIKEKGSLNI